MCVCRGGGEEGEEEGGGGWGGGGYRDAIQADRRAGVIFLVSAKRLKLKEIISVKYESYAVSVWNREGKGG